MTAGGPVAGATGGGLRFEYEIDWRLCAGCMRAGGLWPGSGHSVYGRLNHGQRHQPTGAEPDAYSAAAKPAAAESAAAEPTAAERSEEHTSELQSPCNLVCRLLLEKKKIKEYAVFAVLD